ncbi:MAG: hypothetical protein ACLQGP_36565 [Isosphaeraceae bacterium]
MNAPLVDQIADVVLYEGYLLYPYRPTVKNRQRWTFGGLYPRSYSEAQRGTDPWMSQTECLVQTPSPKAFVGCSASTATGGFPEFGARRAPYKMADETSEAASPRAEGTTLSVRVRFLQLQLRRVERAGFSPTDADGLSVWQEAVEREIDTGEHELAELVATPLTHAFAFPGRCQRESAPDPGDTIVREQEPIAGSIELAAERAEEGLYKVTVKVFNTTPFELAGKKSRDEALLKSLVSTNAILVVRGGEFVSSTDPPEPWRAIAAGCRNIGAWPVLVGELGERNTMLSAPIILYDYPQIAPESPGDLFGSTEIDEILTLRILTLTDDEKKAMANIDERARTLLKRTESMAREQLMGLHCTVRGLRPL